MSTEDEKDVKGWFPPGFEHLEPWVAEVQKKIAEIDKAIGNLPNDKGPYPSPRPTDEIPRIDPASRESILRKMDERKSELKDEARAKIGDAVKDCDPKTAKTVRDKAEFLMDEENVYRDMPKDELDERSGEEKSNGQEFDYITAYYFTSGELFEKNAHSPKIREGEVQQPVTLEDVPNPLDYFNDILDSYHSGPTGLDEKVRSYQENKEDIERGDD